MSGYRSLKRVLGETNLERKFRWLFGLSIGTLIFLAFFWAGRIARNLIEETAEHKGSDLVRVALFSRHWYVFEKDPAGRQLQEHLTQELAHEAVDARFLKLDAGPEPPLMSTPLYQAENDTERAILELSVGEALVSLLDAKGTPAVTERAWVAPPSSQIGPISDADRDRLRNESSRNYGHYDKAVDRESAYEKLTNRTAEKADRRNAAGVANAAADGTARTIGRAVRHSLRVDRSARRTARRCHRGRGEKRGPFGRIQPRPLHPPRRAGQFARWQRAPAIMPAERPRLRASSEADL